MKYIINTSHPSIQIQFACRLGASLDRFSLLSMHLLQIPSVLVHGDMWSMNLLFHKDSSNRATDEVRGIIDWQLVHTGSICEDLVRLLVSSCDAQLRRDIEQEVLEYYYMQLEMKMDGKVCTACLCSVKYNACRCRLQGTHSHVRMQWLHQHIHYSLST
jgi:hypothetical protein